MEIEISLRNETRCEGMQKQHSSRTQFENYLEQVRKSSGAASQTYSHSQIGRRSNRTRSTWELIAAFFGLLKPFAFSMFIALSTLTIGTLLGLIPPAATKFVIDYALTNQPVPDSITRWVQVPSERSQLLLWICGIVVLISLIRTGIQLWGRWLATRTTKRIQMHVRKTAFAQAIRLPLHRVHDLKTGGVASILREDAGSVGDLVFGMVYNPWRAIVQLVGSLCVLLWVDWRLLIGTILFLPMIFATHRIWVSRIRPRYRDIRNQRQEVDAQATEAFGGIRIVRGFSRAQRENIRFMESNHLLARQELYVWWWARLIEAAWDTLIPLGIAGLLGYGGWQVLQNQLSVGDLMMFLVYLLMLLEPLAVLAQSATQFQNSLSGLDRVLDLLEEPRELADHPGSLKLIRNEVPGEIAFQAVSFQYPGSDAHALRQIDLVVHPGETIALVGPSGAGKTSLCNLVARFYDPSEGDILLDGRNLCEIEVESYRRILGIVEQEVFLFDGTIAENIGYANRLASEEQIVQAAHIANAAEFIEQLPDGYNAVIGERGIKLSGGQRQRIAIARAVLADPKILILDEATSNLDTQNERLIQQGLLELISGRTCFVIAHRLSTITHADRIIVLADGQILESGTHDELLKAGGTYREMVEAQIANHPLIAN